MEIQPKQPTVKNPAEQFTTTTTWLEHVTDEEYSA